MLNQDDITKIIEAGSEVFATKEDLKEATNNLSTKDDFNKMMNAVDKYAVKADTYFQEMVALSHI